MKNNKLIVICGPTASGKTAKSIELAQALQTEIISADARQFYEELNIGVAKPSEEQLHTVKHHFIGNIPLSKNYTPADFEREALALLEVLFQKKQHVILCGGSGLYINALCYGLDDIPPISEEVKKLVATLSTEECLAIIQEKDNEYYDHMDRGNMRRIQRATEVILSTGHKFSELRTGERKQRFFEIEKLAVEIDREQLYNNINKRVDMMVEQGLEQEARTLYPILPNKNLDTIGYREFFDYFENKISKAEAIEKIKQHTRNYAKRQMTWFRKDSDIKWLSTDDWTALLKAQQS